MTDKTEKAQDGAAEAEPVQPIAEQPAPAPETAQMPPVPVFVADTSGQTPKRRWLSGWKLITAAVVGVLLLMAGTAAVTAAIVSGPDKDDRGHNRDWDEFQWDEFAEDGPAMDRPRGSKSRCDENRLPGRGYQQRGPRADGSKQRGAWQGDAPGIADNDDAGQSEDGPQGLEPAPDRGESDQDRRDADSEGAPSTGSAESAPSSPAPSSPAPSTSTG